MAKKLKTVVDIDVFICKLLYAGIKLPINVDIKIELSKKEFNNIVPLPFGLKDCDEAEYCTLGMKVLLTTKKK